jgi:hypothetical protein
MASGSTPVQARPYPLESDVPDVAADLHALALSLENVSPNLAVAWTNLSLAGGLGTVSGAYTPGSRAIGDTIELRGAVKNTTGSSKTSPVSICTLAAPFRPASTIYLTTDTFLGNGIAVEITTGGVMTLLTDATGLLSGDFALLDGLSYPLS